MSNISPFTVILLILGLSIALVDDSLMIAWGPFFLATLNEALRVWAARVPAEHEKFE